MDNGDEQSSLCRLWNEIAVFSQNAREMQAIATLIMGLFHFKASGSAEHPARRCHICFILRKFSHLGCGFLDKSLFVYGERIMKGFHLVEDASLLEIPLNRIRWI